MTNNNTGVKWINYLRDQHDKGYEYDEDEINPREINTSYLKDPWFDYLQNDIVDYNPFHTLASGLRVQPK